MFSFERATMSPLETVVWSQVYLHAVANPLEHLLDELRDHQGSDAAVNALVRVVGMDVAVSLAALRSADRAVGRLRVALLKSAELEVESRTATRHKVSPILSTQLAHPTRNRIPVKYICSCGFECGPRVTTSPDGIDHVEPDDRLAIHLSFVGLNPEPILSQLKQGDTK